MRIGARKVGLERSPGFFKCCDNAVGIAFFLEMPGDDAGEMIPPRLTPFGVQGRAAHDCEFSRGRRDEKQETGFCLVCFKREFAKSLVSRLEHVPNPAMADVDDDSAGGSLLRRLDGVADAVVLDPVKKVADFHGRVTSLLPHLRRRNFRRRR
jgi:hypothetical protein